MKQWKHPVFLLMTAALLFIISPVYVHAENSSREYGSQDPVSADTVIQVNPLYADIFSKADLESALSAVPWLSSETEPDEETVFSSSQDASAWLRRMLVSRSTRAEFSYITEDSDYYNVVRSLFHQALEETGSPEEGDYLRYQYGGYACSVSYYTDGSSYHYNLTYTIHYYTTWEQEQQVTAEVSRILSELDLEEKTAYEKTEAIYRYLVSGVSYDYTNLNDNDYTLKYSAYAALINKTAICQGYAAALYRLMMEAGIPCRIIGGAAGASNHAWNIIQQKGLWYNADPTWDSEAQASSGTYSWFLLSDENFHSHSRDDQYLTDDFYRSYPMGPENFDPDAPEESAGSDPDMPEESAGSSIAALRMILNQPIVSLSNSASGITVKWSRVKGASGYRIYRKTSEGWTEVKNIKDPSVLSWTETGLENGTRYIYSVRACYGSTTIPGFSCQAIYHLSSPSIASLKNTGNEAMVIKWLKNKAADGYQIRYVADSSFKEAKTITISKNTSSARLIRKNISSLKKGTRYYVQIRSFKTTKGTRTYSAWSPVKNVIIR
ncbi:MAG: transglutaminase domain-containing protein [Lachnospiraceae bacterium]|nr:transglutaminase domain-containing protein [Lachnospiraceae bacterium]